MASTSGYALSGAMGAIEFVLRSIAGFGGRFPTEATSFVIGVALMAGLQHPVRRKIYEHLLRLPGDHFRSVARSLHLAVGTARYHLDALARDGLVYKEETNGRARYYVTGGEADVNRLYARHWEFRQVRLRILGAVRRLGKAQPATIAKVLGISRQLVSYHLACLEKAGRVRRDGALYRAIGMGRRDGT
jgi:predicted transcriptional regulator